MAQTTEFRGYGPVTLAATGLLALVAASAQALWLPDPAKHILIYVSIWVSTAVASATLIGVQTVTRTRRIHSSLADEMIHMAVEQFLPSVAAGALLTLLLVRSVPSVLWMLPGLWQITFSLGVFASCRFFATANGCSWSLVPFRRARFDCTWTWPCTFTLDNGRCLWSRAVFSCGDPIFQNRREPR